MKDFDIAKKEVFDKVFTDYQKLPNGEGADKIIAIVADISFKVAYNTFKVLSSE